MPPKKLDDFEIKNNAVASPIEWSEIVLIVIGILIFIVVALVLLKKLGVFESRCFLGIREVLFQFKTDVQNRVGNGFIRLNDVMMNFHFQSGRRDASNGGNHHQNPQTNVKQSEIR